MNETGCAYCKNEKPIYFINRLDFNLTLQKDPVFVKDIDADICPKCGKRLKLSEVQKKNESPPDIKQAISAIYKDIENIENNYYGIFPDYVKNKVRPVFDKIFYKLGKPGSVHLRRRTVSVADFLCKMQSFFENDETVEHFLFWLQRAEGERMRAPHNEVIYYMNFLYDRALCLEKFSKGEKRAKLL